MLYKVLEVAKMLGVSKVTIYKKLKQHEDELANNIIIKGKITYLDETGVEIITSKIQKMEGPDSKDAEFVTNEKVYLEHQLSKKEKLLSEKEKLIADYKRMIKSVRGKILYSRED